MNVSKMRFIDRCVGVPACFILSPFSWLSDRLHLSRSSRNLSRTLFIELSEMGSAILADPAMRKLKREGRAELLFVIFKQNYKSLEILNTVDRNNVFVMNADNFLYLLRDIGRFIVWCRRKRISAVIDL